MTTATTIGQKLWNYCNVLRNAGLSYGDYLEQLTYLIFLKMMHERTLPPLHPAADYQPPPIPEGCRLAQTCWPGTARSWTPTTGAHAGNPVPTAGHAGGDLSARLRTASRNRPC